MEATIGQIQPFGFNFAPRSWSTCSGQLMPISNNTALFSLIGTFYGGDGRTTFALPDLRGRAALGFGDGPGVSPVPIGQRAGAETVTLNTLHMPSHNHTASFTPTGGSPSTLNAIQAEATTQDPAGNMLADPPGLGGKVYAPRGDNEPIAMDPASITGGSAGGAVTVNNTGGNQPFEIRNPYLGINYSIALYGIFPSRN